MSNLTSNVAWDHYHNWQESFVSTYEFSTEVIRSRSGKEQRIANRIIPRKTLTYQRTFVGQSLRDFTAHMWQWQNRTYVLPELPRKIMLTDAPVAAGTIQLNVPAPMPSWMLPNAMVIFVFDGKQEVRTVLGVSGSVVTFKAATANEWSIGTTVYYAVSGHLDGSVSATRKTNTVAAASLTFNVIPLSEPYQPPPPPPGQVLNNREILTLRPNWAEDIPVTHEYDTEVVDYGRGPVSRFYPVNFGTMLRTHTYIGRTHADAEAMIDFFYRRYGRQGEFYTPTWDSDLLPVGVSPASTSNIRVKGRPTFDAYANSTVHKAIAVSVADGTIFYRVVESISLITDLEGVDSVLTLTEPLPVDVGPGVTNFISWLMVWAFASDILTIENITDSVTQFKIAMRSLEDIPIEVV